MSENIEQIQPAKSSKDRQGRRRAPQKNSTVISVRKCGSEYELRISRRFVKFGLIPLVSGLLGLGAGNVSWDWLDSEKEVSTAASPPAQSSAPAPDATPFQREVLIPQTASSARTVPTGMVPVVKPPEEDDDRVTEAG